MPSKFFQFASLFILFATSLPAVSIAPTDPLSPQEQRTKFKLPEGFVIELVVAEPDIGQPMNLNFDAKGRLWVTSSVEYPYPAAGDIDEPAGRFKQVSKHMPQDWLTVVTDLAPNGQAQTVQRFASGLNIPIGTVPLGDGSSVLTYDIPSIRRHTDTNNDGVADEGRTVYTRFGHRDTHGMASSFTRWADGWIYGCHGFANTSKITDGRGVTTELFSGNTYRFRHDGSHFEQFTSGQINPFGITFDALGNIYNADCHSMPVYMLLRGGTYLRPSWGRPKKDSLGFAPKMIDHNHGSTGICGPAIYDAPHFPSEYRDSLFLCNPVTGKVHWDKLKPVGSSKFVDTQPDFITCADPWFRPVDAVVGPDGALYIADFYNSIIGHYEVPLEHPKRDRTHGRVWRIRYKGKGQPAPKLPDLTQLELPELIQHLGDPNLVIRTLALNYLVDSYGRISAQPVKLAMEKGSADLVAYGMWALERTLNLDDALLSKLAKGSQVLPRIFAMKILAGREVWSPSEEELILGGLEDADATVQRAAADALTDHLLPRSVPTLLAAWRKAHEGDTHLIHVLRMALRHQLKSIEDFSGIAKGLHYADRERFTSIAGLVGTEAALTFAAARMSVVDIQRLEAEDPGQLLQFCSAAQKLPDDTFVAFISRLRKAELSQPFQAKVLGTFGTQAAAKDWAQELASEMLDYEEGESWEPIPLGANPWVTQERKSADGKEATFWSSLPRGEKLTGKLRSPVFASPSQLTFFIAGHDNPPSQKLGEANYIRLVHDATGKELKRTSPPRNDTAQKVTWELEGQVGKEVRIEIVDGHEGAGYAWLAVGRFDPPVMSVEQNDFRQTGIDLARKFALRGLSCQLISILADSSAPTPLRATAGNTLLGWSAKHAEPVLGAMASAPAALQLQLAKSLAGNVASAETLLVAIESGKASSHLLRDKQLVERIQSLNLNDAESRISVLVSLLPPAAADLQGLLQSRRKLYHASGAIPDKGKAVFNTYCAVCHKLGGQGGAVGPSLDGIGNRGLDRLLEDLLDPDRNIDPAFAMTTITTKVGEAISGIGLHTDGRNVVLTDASGTRRVIPKTDIATQKTSNLSIMPAALTRAIPESEFVDLMKYLLGQK